jgi:uncharacterized protein YndB with AHSA1/START domain
MKTMEERSVIHSTFVIQRSYSATPEQVFRAFSDPAKKRRWFVDAGGNQIDEYELDFRVGGKECARFRFKEGSPVAGLTCVNQGSYQDIVPNERVVAAFSMTIAGKCISVALITAEFQRSANGTDLVFTHQGVFFEGSDGPKLREAGWQKMFDYLGAEIPHA